jgi:hypothetical protein
MYSYDNTLGALTHGATKAIFFLPSSSRFQRQSHERSLPHRSACATSGRAASLEAAKVQFLTNWQKWRIKTEFEKRLALEVAEPRSLKHKRKRQMLYSQISKYVAVRRDRGEQMKAIVPAAAKRFAVSERTVWAAVGSGDSTPAPRPST